jgi:uncharacterized protein YkwD
VRHFKILITFFLVFLFSFSVIIHLNNTDKPKIKVMEVKGSYSTSKAVVNTVDINTIPQADLNNYENTIAVDINNYRIDNGLNVLNCDLSLTYVAKLRSQDMLYRDYFSHYTPEGENVTNILKSLGINYKKIGENLANAFPASYGDPAAFMDLWENSPSHNYNLLRVEYNRMGIGVIDNGDRIVLTTVFTD